MHNINPCTHTLERICLSFRCKGIENVGQNETLTIPPKARKISSEQLKNANLSSCFLSIDSCFQLLVNKSEK